MKINFKFCIDGLSVKASAPRDMSIEDFIGLFNRITTEDSDFVLQNSNHDDWENDLEFSYHNIYQLRKTICTIKEKESEGKANQF